MRHPSAWLTVVLIIAIDRAAKWLAVLRLRDQPAMHLWGGLLRLEYHENPGAFLSLGATLSDTARFWIFVVLVSAFIAWSLWMIATDRSGDRWRVYSLAAIAGGGIGNLIDRIFQPNQGVIDFLQLSLSWSTGSIGTGVFNVADMAISGGALFLLWKSLRQSNAPRSSTRSQRRRKNSR